MVSSLGQRISGAARDASRSTRSLFAHAAPIPVPGLLDIKDAAKKLVDGLQLLDDYEARRQMLSGRITSILNILELHSQSQDGEMSPILHYFYNKLETCQKQLSRLDSNRGLSRSLRVSRQLEIMERLDREIDSNLQDTMLAVLLERFSVPPKTMTLEPIAEPLKERGLSGINIYNRPRIKRYQISMGAIVKRTRINVGDGSAMRSVAHGKYRDRHVLVVQYSSKSSPDRAAKAFSHALSVIIQEQHPNVLGFMGASDDSLENYCIVFDVGRTMSKELFIQALHSMHDAFSFLGGVKSGMQFLLDHGIQTWVDIHVAEAGHAIVCPPYWENASVWEQSNYDVFSCLTGITGPSDFPLSTLSEILNIAGNRWSEFESALATCSTGLRDYHLMQVAGDLAFPVPPFLLIYYGPLPEFLVSVGSVGVPEWLVTGQPGDCFHGSMTNWHSLSSVWACSGWEALQTCALECWTSGGGLPVLEGYEYGSLAPCGGSVEPWTFEPLNSSSDGWLSYGHFESFGPFGVAYEVAISDSALFEQSWKRFSETRLPMINSFAEEDQAVHAVRHISVSIQFKPRTISMCGSFPFYFHRRPSAMFNVEQYWGFLSDSPDPTISPCQFVKSMEVIYSIKINTLRVNDDWRYRAEKCFESVILRTPGAFDFD